MVNDRPSKIKLGVKSVFLLVSSKLPLFLATYHILLLLAKRLEWSIHKLVFVWSHNQVGIQLSVLYKHKCLKTVNKRMPRGFWLSEKTTITSTNLITNALRYDSRFPKKYLWTCWKSLFAVAFLFSLVIPRHSFLEKLCGGSFGFQFCANPAWFPGIFQDTDWDITKDVSSLRSTGQGVYMFSKHFANFLPGAYCH